MLGLKLNHVSERGHSKLNSTQYVLPNFVNMICHAFEFKCLSFIKKMPNFIQSKLFNNLNLFKYSGKQVYFKTNYRRFQWVIGTCFFVELYM